MQDTGTSHATDDAALLRAVSRGDRTAMDAVVRRHMGLVYSCARRQILDVHSAEDVTQAVFLILQRKAGPLARRPVLASWLIVTTRYVARNMRTRQQRRQHYEHLAASQRTDGGPRNDRAEHTEVLPMLDDALASLGNADRNAVVLRFFEGLSFEQVAFALGTTPEAARKRVNRAVERMRKLCARRGVVMSSDCISAAILASAAVQAPPGLAAGVVTAMSGAPSIAAACIAGSTARSFVLKPLGIAAAIAASVTMAAGVLVAQLTSPPAAQNPTSAPAIAPQPADKAAWRMRFEEMYQLGPDEVIRHIPPPFIPEREAYVRSQRLGVAVPQEPPTVLWLRTDGSEFKFDCGWGPDAVSRISAAMERVMGLQPREFYTWQDELRKVLPGDWVVREGASKEQLMDGLARILSRSSADPLVFRARQSRDVVRVARGRPQPDSGQIHVTIPLKRSELRRMVKGNGPIHRMLSDLALATSLPLFVETEPASQPVIHYSLESEDTPVPDEEYPFLDQRRWISALESVAQQTGIQIDEQMREWTRWDLVRMEPWRAEFEQQYALSEGVSLRNVPPPFSEQRNRYMGETFAIYKDNLAAHARITWRNWPAVDSFGWASSQSVRWAMRDIVGLPEHQIEVDEALAEVQVKGDWIVREGSSFELRLADLAGIVEATAGRPVRVTHSQQSREVIVLRGSTALYRNATRNAVMAGVDPAGLMMLPLADDTWTPVSKGVFGGPLKTLTDHLFVTTGVPFVTDGVDDWAGQFEWKWMPLAAPDDEDPLDTLLASLQDQTGMDLSRKLRSIVVWRIELAQ